MSNKLLTVAEVAEALRIKPATVRSWLLRGKINSYRVGRAVRIEEAEIERLLKEGRRPAKEKDER